MPDKEPSFLVTTDMPEFFDRDGKPMTLSEWSLQINSEEYKRVDETWIHGQHYSYQVSTVWLGMSGYPFETMVFSRGPSDPARMDLHQIRCDNLLEAERQHGSVVVRLNQKLGLTQ